jgi:hypothetical protein
VFAEASLIWILERVEGISDIYLVSAKLLFLLPSKDLGSVTTADSD